MSVKKDAGEGLPCLGVSFVRLWFMPAKEYVVSKGAGARGEPHVVGDFWAGLLH